MTTFPLRLTDELEAMATAQAARAGVSLNQYIATLLATHVAGQAEAERYFAVRAARVVPTYFGNVTEATPKNCPFTVRRGTTTGPCVTAPVPTARP